MPEFTPNKPKNWQKLGLKEFDEGRVIMTVDDISGVTGRGLGFRGVVTDEQGRKWDVYGASCGLPRCNCAAAIKPHKEKA